MSSIEYSVTDEVWYVDGVERDVDWQGYVQLFNEELTALSAPELRAALKAEAGTAEPSSSTAYVASVPRGYEDEGGPYEPVSFEWDGVALTVVIAHVSEADFEDEADAEQTIRQLLQPVADDLAATHFDVTFDDWVAANAMVTIRVAVPVEDRTVAHLLQTGHDLLRLCDAFSAKEVSRETVGNFIRGGAAHLIVGQEEGNWFDAKKMLYEDSLSGAISLAQDVARFCNAEDGGLILIGAATKSIPGGERVTKVRGVNAPRGTAATYSGILGRHVYPLPDGLRIDVVPLPNGRSVVAIDVPPQADVQKPFLVHGAIRTDGEVEGAFISIVRRRGEASVPITAPMIHALLAAGRTRLRADAESL